MRFAPLLPVLFVTSLLGGVMLIAASASAQTTAAKIATANPARIFSELQETKDLKVSMEAKQKQLQNQEFEKRQKLKDLQAQRDQLKPDAPQYNDRNRELLQGSVEFETWGRLVQADVQSEQKRQMISLFVKITNAVQEVATSKGIDIVIAEQHPEFDQVNLDQLNVEQVRALINSNNVLFKSAQVDISADVIAAMDAKYKTGK